MSRLTGKILGSARKLVFTPVKRLLNAIDEPVLVLLYHRVTSLASDPEMLAVTPEHFRAQLLHLKKQHQLVRFEEDWSRLSKPAVAITFDDGYADNVLEALPIIEELGVPATFFISTGTIGTPREFWWNELERLILAGERFPERCTLVGHGVQDRACGSTAQRTELYHELVAVMTRADAERRAGLLEELRRWRGATGEPGTGNRALSVEELRRLSASSLVTIGAHTVHHVQLSTLPREAQREEMESSKRALEQWLDKEVTTFSYPYGRRSHYTRESVALCRELGFAKAASNFPGQAHRWSDPYQVPRHLVRDWPVEEFAARLRGFWTR